MLRLCYGNCRDYTIQSNQEENFKTLYLKRRTNRGNLSSFYRKSKRAISTLNKAFNIDEEKPKNQFSEFSGMWKDRDITKESIRKEAWN